MFALCSYILVVFFDVLDRETNLENFWGWQSEENDPRVAVLSDEKEGYGGQKQGLKHVTY